MASARAERATATANASIDTISPARNGAGDTPPAASSKALRPAASGTIVTANRPSVTHAVMTIQRPDMREWLPAEGADGREVAGRDQLEPRREMVVRELAGGA